MFIDNMPAKESSFDVLANEMVRRLNEYSNRMKNVELRLERLEGRVTSIEETVLGQLNNLKVGLERLGQKISLVSERLESMENEILRINKELGKTALKSDIKKIETFIDIVNPVTSKFVTKEELERILEEREKASS
jgi:chromosome segregation ATPase